MTLNFLFLKSGYFKAKSLFALSKTICESRLQSPFGLFCLFRWQAGCLLVINSSTWRLRTPQVPSAFVKVCASPVVLQPGTLVMVGYECLRMCLCVCVCVRLSLDLAFSNRLFITSKKAS